MSEDPAFLTGARYSVLMLCVMKTCFKCKINKNLESFYKHSEMADGHLNKCINCAKKDALKHRNNNLSKVAAYDINRPKKE